LSAQGNWLQPCPFRDHHEQFQQWIERYELEPEDDSALAAVTDPQYREAMVSCALGNRQVTRTIWEQDYLGTG
jgi:hypothetical protein